MGFLKFWGKIRESVAGWLRSQKLENSVLMDAWVGVNKYVDAAARMVASAMKKPKAKLVSHSEKVLREEEIDDPEVRAAVKKLKPKKKRTAKLVH